mmetsp:Transcript_37932/g.90095  ORF Transcript_37932/g.90095 Transcript_37932/m.90095 type:complete len:214 (+) Transcript_37932:159-800(+)
MEASQRGGDGAVHSAEEQARLLQPTHDEHDDRIQRHRSIRQQLQPRAVGPKADTPRGLCWRAGEGVHGDGEEADRGAAGQGQDRLRLGRCADERDPRREGPLLGASDVRVRGGSSGSCQGEGGHALPAAAAGVEAQEGEPVERPPKPHRQVRSCSVGRQLRQLRQLRPSAPRRQPRGAEAEARAAAPSPNPPPFLGRGRPTISPQSSAGAARG